MSGKYGFKEAAAYHRGQPQPSGWMQFARILRFKEAAAYHRGQRDGLAGDATGPHSLQRGRGVSPRTTAAAENGLATTG